MSEGRCDGVLAALCRKPEDLDLAFHPFRGGMKGAGLGREEDERLNPHLKRPLRPVSRAALALGSSAERANLLMVDCIAHATRLLLLHTPCKTDGGTCPSTRTSWTGISSTAPLRIRRLIRPLAES